MLCIGRRIIFSTKIILWKKIILSCLKTNLCVCVRKFGVRIRIGGGGFSALGWGDCLEYLKRGWNRKEGSGNKHSKKGASLIKGWVS